MASWTALNVAEGDARDGVAQERATEEAQDADNAAMYGQALRCQQLQQVDKAKHIYQELLNGNVAVNSRLEYLCNKNLATMEFEDHMYEAALQYFAEALALDATDVVVWYQMATTAIETGKLWLARRTLEEGIKVDSTYWPLVETLAEVLHEIGDIDEYERMAAYIRANDPQCASIRIIDDVVAAKRGDVSDSTGPFEAKKKRPRPSTRDLKLLNRAQRRLDHLREIAESSAKRRKLLHEELSQELETAIMPRQYQLQSPSWMTLGKLLLEAFEDVNRGATTNVIRATVGIGVSYERQQATSAIAERPCTDSVNAEVEQKIGNTSLPDETNISRAQKNGSDQPPPAKCTKDKELVSFPSCVDPSTNAVSTGASDNDTQESVHTSEVDDLQPIRRKSRRNEERQREEHAAAIKKAREKDLAYRLGAFIPKNVDDAMSEPASLKWLLPLRVEFIGTEFRVLNESNEVIAQVKSFVSPSASDEPKRDTESQPEHRSPQDPASQEEVSTVPLEECISGYQIDDFLGQGTTQRTSPVGVLEWVRRYLNQCGQWAHMKLGGVDEDIQQVLIWLEKVLNGELDASNSIIEREYSTVNVADHSLIQGSRFEGNGLALSAQLLMLELHFDLLLQQPVRGKRRRRMRKQIEEQVAQAQRLLFEFSWLEDSDEMDGSCCPTPLEFVRLFWLIARMHERCGNPQMAQSYYCKCRDRLRDIVAEGMDGLQDNGFRLTLPNLKADSEITLAIIVEKISGLRFSDVCSEARRLSVKGDHDRVVSLLLEYFFPSNQDPRMIDFLSEFEVDEDGSQSQENGKLLFEMVLESMKQSSTFSDDDAVGLLLTTLYHVLVFLEGLSVEVKPNTSQDQPDEVYANAFAALKFLLARLSETHCDSITSRNHHSLLRALSMRCLEPSILLRFDCPSAVLLMLSSLLNSKPQGPETVGGDELTAVDAMARLFLIIRLFSNEDLRKLSPLESHPVKKKHPRRDRVRVLLVELLRYMNRVFQGNEAIARSFPLTKRFALMKLCCAMMKEEEETVARSDSKSAQQLCGNGAILFIFLYEGFHRPSTRVVPTQLVELIHLLHKRLGQHGICGLVYVTEVGSSHTDSRGSACFLEACMQLLSKYVKHVGIHEKSPEGDNSLKESADDNTDDNDDEEDMEAEDLFKKTVCQCFRCLYDVQILPGCDDHKTGNTFASLQNEKQSVKHADAMRLARFAVPILLSTKPKTNGQKKENLKLLYAVRDALSDSTFAAFSAHPQKVSPPLLKYLSPKGLMQWEDPLPLPFDDSGVKEESADDTCLSHLWYLLGANYILGRVKRRGNLGELKEMEQHVKERVEYLTKDVLYYHPDRIDSWIRLGKTMKELYHAATDAFAAILGRKLRVQAILEYTRKVSVQNPVERGDKEDIDSDKLSFAKVVLSWNLFGNMKERQDRDNGAHGSSGKQSTSKEKITKDGAQDRRLEDTILMEDFAIAYIVQVIEFSRRCFAMAARLAELAAKERELKLQTKRGNGGNGDDDDNFDEELDNLRTTTIECNEECGLLLFNVLQEFSLMKEVDLVYFPDVVYSRMIEQVLAYFRKGMEICEGDDDANEIRFRLLYMIGKTLKKMRWCELRQQKASDPEALVTAKEMAECFAKAEASREEGDMEHALVHAFYALQGLRADLILSESPSVSALQLVCDHYFEEEDEEEEEEGDDGEDEDGVTGKKDDRDGAGTMNEAATLKSSSTNPTASEVTSFNNIAQDETNAANPSRKDEILALLSDNKSDNFTREVNVTVARGWLALNIIDALESIPNEDRYFHPSRYVLARVVYWLSNFHNVLINCGYKDDNIGALVEAVKARRSQLKVDGPSDAAARAVKEMAPLFDKRRPQIVAIWFSEYIPAAKKFEELNQRQMKYDYYRLKYWRFYVGMLEENMAYARLKEIGTWVMACKEEHDVISIMLGIVLQARGKVLRARLQGAMDKLGSANVVVASVSEPTNSVRPQLSGGDQPVDTVFKQLAKAYAYYLEVVDAQSRLIQVMENSGLLLEYAELPMVAVFFLGVTAYPSQVLLLEKDRALMDIHFLDNVTVIKNALRRGELPPRIYDAQGREAWRSYLDAARSFCEEKWPERSGKGKVVKNRSRVKPSGSSSSETNASQPAPDTSN